MSEIENDHLLMPCLYGPAHGKWMDFRTQPGFTESYKGVDYQVHAAKFKLPTGRITECFWYVVAAEHADKYTAREVLAIHGIAIRKDYPLEKLNPTEEDLAAELQ